MINTEFAFSPFTQQVFIISQLLVVIVATFLAIITIKAYTNTKFKKMIFVVIAFALFGISHLLNFLDQAIVDIMPDDVRFAMFGVVQLSIMAMFFLAIMKK